MPVSSRKLIKSQNLIEVDSEKRFITNEEKDFIITIFDKYFIGLHKNNPISEQSLYGIIFDIAKFYNLNFDKDFYIFKDCPVNDLYFTYGFKIPKSLGSEFYVIRYVLTYISENYGLPNNRYGKQYKTQITTDEQNTIIGV